MNSVRKQILAAMGGAALVTALAPGMALAADPTGDFTVTGGDYGTDYTFADNVLTVKSDKPLTIKNDDQNKATGDRIVVEKDKDANLTLAGVNIQAPSDKAALEIEGDSNGGSSGDVGIALADGSRNVLRGGADAAGLQKNGQSAAGTLTIEGPGSLEAAGDRYGAGIGGGGVWHLPDMGTDNITIAGGTVKATGGRYGAGIGAGRSSDDPRASNISITGGAVTATGTDGAGIGGAYSQNDGMPVTAENITISGGTVTASSDEGAGIGGGSRASASNVFIGGGSVKATSERGADIGSGYIFNGSFDPLTPRNKPDGEEVQLLEISNPKSERVTIDSKSYTPVNHGPGDTTLYAYLTKQEHSIVVGDKRTVYKYESGQFVPGGTVSLTNPVTLRVNADSNEWEVSYDDGYTWQPVLDGEGNPVKATGEQGDKGDTGQSGATPQLRVAGGYWQVSYDHGANWNDVLDADGHPVKATGAKGDTGATGAKGVKGETGATGAAGAKGAKGDKGDRGDTGAAGKDGAAPQIKIDKDGYWCASYDNGKTWVSLGVKAPVAEKYATTSKATASFSGSKIGLSWNRIEDASGYEVYVARCGSGGELTGKKHLAKTVKRASTLKASFKKVDGKKVNAKYSYQAKVRAYKTVKGKKTYLTSSPTMHVVSTANGTYTNAEKVTVDKDKVSLKAGKSATVKAKVAKASGKKKLLSPKTHVASVRWYSTDKKVAAVSPKGRITAKKKGSCTVRAVAANGKSASVKVTVK